MLCTCAAAGCPACEGQTGQTGSSRSSECECVGVCVCGKGQAGAEPSLYLLDVSRIRWKVHLETSSFPCVRAVAGVGGANEWQGVVVAVVCLWIGAYRGGTLGLFRQL